MEIIRTINSMYNKITASIKNMVVGRKEVKPDDVPDDKSNSNFRQREINLFGEKRLQQQKVYEKWIVKETWNLKKEGLPLLFGLDPENTNWKSKENEDYQNINDLWEHAQQCVEQGLLSVKNKLDQPETWLVIPSDIYHWATVSRVSVPETFSTLMEFVLNVTKPHTILYSVKEFKLDDKDYANAIVHDKEKILGIALAILAAYPDRCRDNKGKVIVNDVVEIINEKGKFWFGDQKPKMSNDAMRNLINRWLQTVN